jgi:succinate dehydrogenase/fumarate reductase-like Fe-S protein
MKKYEEAAEVETKEIKVTCFRFDPMVDKSSRMETYVVPIDEMTSVLNVLEYIQKNCEPSLAYYSCCRRGLCAKCNVKVNGVNGLACEMVVEGDMIIEPVHEDRVQRDLVTF